MYVLWVALRMCNLIEKAGEFIDFVCVGINVGINYISIDINH